MKATTEICRACYAVSFCLFTGRMKARCKGPFRDKRGQIRFLKETVLQSKGQEIKPAL